jgi:phosphohistidine phosphatase
MDLLLWRHAEAEDIADGGDLERELTPKGRAQATAMARWLKNNGPRDPRILVSPAMRTQQTAQAFSKHFETCVAISPNASVSDLLKASGWPKGLVSPDEAVILVGHQPTLGQVAAKLISGRESSWSVKKGALWWLQRRVRGESEETILRLVMSADLA